MEKYRITYKRNVFKDYKKISSEICKKIINKIDELSNLPYPVQSKPLKGKEYTHRLRVGDYRVLYSVNEQKNEILVIKIKHRREVYR